MNKNKIKDCGIFLFIWILCGGLFLIPFSNADELWNYNFAKAITEGLTPYADINMIPTPLASYVAALFLMIFGKGLFAYRIAGYVVMGITFSIYYMLCKRLLGNRLFAFMSTMLMWVMNIYSYIYSYNTLTLMFVLVVLLLEWGEYSDENKLWPQIAIGIICGLLPLIKQSTGAVLFFANIISCVFYLKQKDKVRKPILLRIGVSFIPGIIYVLYLLVSGTFQDFWDYAVMGIGTFSHRILLFDYMKSSPLNGIIVLALVAMLIYIVFKLVIKKEGKLHQYVCATYVVGWLFAVSYPLCDNQHLFLGILPLMILFFSCVEESEKFKNGIFYANLIVSTFLVVLLVNAGLKLQNYKFCELHNYEGVLIEPKLEEKIETICEYIKEQEIQGKKVYLAYEYAAMFMIPLDKYTKNWDLLLVGNVGTNSVKDLLDIEENSVILVLKDGYTMNRQAHFELISYVKENYILIDEVQNFDVYKEQD